jgi:DNA-binding CsgD family transcriptional regulator
VAGARTSESGLPVEPAAAGGLLERTSELRVLRESVARAGSGEGALVLVEGAAGIGKTALLAEGGRLARRGGVRVLGARGGELERDFPYGVVRQLFEPVLRDTPARQRRELLSGVAALAAPLVAPESAESGTAPAGGDAAFAVLHGLYWLAANVAAREPFVMVVDDVHWSDPPSLRFLLYLARRLSGMAVAVLIAVRTGEPRVETEVLAELASQPVARVLRPAALSERGVALIVGRALGESPDEAFGIACRDATGGVPFLVRELASALAVEGVRPITQMSPRVDGLGPSTVAHATLLRLARLPEQAATLARAVAILGGGATVRRAARLARLDDDEAVEAADALGAAGVLGLGRPLDFVHPIVRTAVYEDLPPGWRSAAHARAARLLEGEGADADEVALHVLSTEPSGRPDVVERLRAAAASAAARGAPENAAVHLRRALAEGAPGRELRASLLHELGIAEKLMRDRGAIDRLQEARDLATDPVFRTRVACDIADMLAFAGQWEPLPELLESALAEIGELDPGLTLRLETQWALVASDHPWLVAELDRRLSSLHAAAERGGSAARELWLLLAWIVAARGEDPQAVTGLVERGLDDGRFLADQGADSWAMYEALAALVIVEENGRAARLTAEILNEARSRGSVIGFVGGATFSALIEVRRGNLTAAEPDLRTALELAHEQDLQMPQPVTLWFGADAICERPELADVATIAETLRLPPGLSASFIGAVALEVRGRLRLQAGNAAGAIDDLQACRAICEALRFCNPNIMGWRSALALALGPAQPAEARRLAADQLSDARRIGIARGIGVALRTAGILEGGDDGLALLREAVATLESSPARLEHARTLVELGAGLRRANHRASARDPLRAGLDLAHRCGATRLAQRARAELAATGAKPRRLRITGRDALTASEQRIARMAAGGLSNRHIAQALFVTAKTVENHLGHVYQKLGVSGRESLAGALEREQPSA